MTQTLVIITDAHRESNLIPLTGKPLTEPQQNEGLSLLARLVASVYGYDVGENLTDWPVGTSGLTGNTGWSSNQWRNVPINSRVALMNTATETLSLPTEPLNGSRVQVIDVNGTLSLYNVTLQGNGRRIDGASKLVLTENNFNKTWIYNSDLAQWVALTELTVDSEMPFPLRFDDYFITKLASRLNPRYGRSLSPETIMRMQEMQLQMESMYRQREDRRANEAVLRLSGDLYRPFAGRANGWMS